MGVFPKGCKKSEHLGAPFVAQSIIDSCRRSFIGTAGDRELDPESIRRPENKNCGRREASEEVNENLFRSLNLIGANAGSGIFHRQK